MARYRKKPVEIDAVRLLPENEIELLQFMSDTGCPFEFVGPWTMVLYTLEGDMTASTGDWIIRGIAGEFYPCKHEIFIESYEMV